MKCETCGREYVYLEEYDKSGPTPDCDCAARNRAGAVTPVQQKREPYPCVGCEAWRLRYEIERARADSYESELALVRARLMVTGELTSGLRKESITGGLQ